MVSADMNSIVAINTYRQLLEADIAHGVYFNSPDHDYFDGSAIGYWRRKAIELGVTDGELRGLEADLRDELERRRIKLVDRKLKAIPHSPEI
jgi:hypothetical protein